MIGSPPFDGANYNALLRAIIEERPRSLRELSAADADLSAIIDTGLAKQRTERFQSMNDLGMALARWLFSQGVFEDVAGTSIDARWLNRRSDSGGRFSRATMESLSGAESQVQPRFTATDPRVSAPTSVASVEVKTRPPLRTRTLVPVAIGLFVTVAFAAFRLWPTAPEPVRPSPAAAAPVAHDGDRVGAAVPAALPTREVAPPASAPASSVTGANLSAAQGRRPPRGARPSGKAVEKPAARERQKLDLMTPY